MRFSGDTDVAGPVQSAGILTPLVPLLGTAKRKENGQVSPALQQLTKLIDSEVHSSWVVYSDESF